MNLEQFGQIGLFGLEALLVGLLMLTFFRLRYRFGLALLYVTLGGFQFSQTLLATTVSVEVLPGIFISPGSAILFSASIFTFLLVYIREDASEARSLIYGIVAANLSLAVIFSLVNVQSASPLAMVQAMPGESTAFQDLSIFLIGTVVLALDVVLTIVIYEFVARLLKRLLFLRIFITLAIVLAVDTFAFLTIAFYGEPFYAQAVTAGLVGKTAAAVVYAALLAGFLQLFEDRSDSLAGSAGEHLRDVFAIMTYRERYDLLREELARDAMTGLYNRGFFDQNLQKELDRAARIGHETSLLLIDIDHFKRVNDELGHQAGDKIIRLLADTIRNTFRHSDLPCRYGGEEFAVIMPDAGMSIAERQAHRLRSNLAEAVADAPRPVTITVGIASFPGDAQEASELLALADKRLYAGKHAGRNRIVGQPRQETDTPS
ncbi:MAG: GGDEF domain-containing protein [Gammaproteobacteria bacterium]|nr:GGDEF domain-containing protein [Gammaproteobacteria bacterium]